MGLVRPARGQSAISAVRAVSGRPLRIYGDGSPIRAWCYVGDIVDAVEAIVANRKRAAGEIFNIGNPREVETTLGLARRILRLSPAANLEFHEMQHSEGPRPYSLDRKGAQAARF